MEWDEGGGDGGLGPSIAKIQILRDLFFQDVDGALGNCLVQLFIPLDILISLVAPT